MSVPLTRAVMAIVARSHGLQAQELRNQFETRKLSVDAQEILLSLIVSHEATFQSLMADLREGEAGQ